MDQKVLQFLTTHKIGVLTTVNINGTPHSATLFYAHEIDPFRIFFLTEKTSKKVQGLLNGETERAAFVTGFSEKEWITFQAEGTISIVLGEEKLQDAQAVYYLKYPNAKHIEKYPNLILLEFRLTWWRYSDITSSPWEIISSHETEND